MSGDVHLRQVPAQTVLVAGRRSPISEMATSMSEAFGSVMTHVAASGAQVVGRPFALYPEMPGEEVTYLVGVPVAPGAAAGPGVELQELPATEAAALRYAGPYADMGPSWARLLAWVESSGRRPAGPMREVYLNDPHEVTPDELLTDLIVPLT